MIKGLQQSSHSYIVTWSMILFSCMMIINSQILIATSPIQQNKALIQTTVESQFPSFDEFVKKYNKKYESGSAQYIKRKQIYQKRIEQLKQMKNDPSIHHEVGVNHLSDLSDVERQHRKPMQVLESKRKQYLAQPIKIKASTTIAPSSRDYRNEGIITSIKDQGECGSCWTFATCAYGESRMMQKGMASKDIDLSQQYLLTCTPQCTCQGGYLEYVFEKAAGGVPTEADYPYSPYMPHSPFICWTGKKVYFGYIPQKHYDLQDSELISLLQSGPVAISVSATNWEDYKGGVFRCKTYDKVNHAVLLIGYTPEYWIIKNQWGQDWGQNGFIRVTRNPLYNCKIGASAFVMWQPYNFLLFGLVFLIALIL